METSPSAGAVAPAGDTQPEVCDVCILTPILGMNFVLPIPSARLKADQHE